MKQTKIISKEEITQQQGYAAQVKNKLQGKGLKAHIRTYGCQQNEADSERLSGMALAMGYSLTDDAEQADLIVVNTCAVREHAELKALSITGQFKHLKAKKPSLLIGVCGCMVSQEHRKENIKHSYPYVDFLFGTSMLYRFPEIVLTALCEEGRHFYLDDNTGNIAEEIPVHRESDFKAWVSIMYGCNNYCTYCVVPFVRGRERSRKKEDILREVNDLIQKGYKEITLLGQNVNSYGKDLSSDYDFADLLEEICQIKGDYWIRFMTSHPKDASLKLIDTIAAYPNIVKQFHLPLQSGSSAVLEKMNRKYSRDDYEKLIVYMREKMPEIAITSDIIVGFPGESEQDFEDTISALKTIQYDNIFSFIYSPRAGTPAAVMQNQIPEEIKKDRFARLLAVQSEISKTKNEHYLGQVERVLVEGYSKTDSSMLTGRNEKNRLVHFKGNDALIGQFINVKINQADTYALIGEICE
ncbi:MAG: tRNA (N6-isopentenyl adenosine(37)-C2)-methylthiotransferase MiaB [Clostridiales bacterium]|nr:tRNA (N6-isopentenyl adenosine(37)-C2)-methylthiotransferase MiaB [Clostridiales bacterium]